MLSDGVEQAVTQRFNLWRVGTPLVTTPPGNGKHKLTFLVIFNQDFETFLRLNNIFHFISVVVARSVDLI